MQQKTGFKNLLLERKLIGLASLLEKKEVQLNEVLAASNLDPSALTVVTHKLEVLDPPNLWKLDAAARNVSVGILLVLPLLTNFWPGRRVEIGISAI